MVRTNCLWSYCLFIATLLTLSFADAAENITGNQTIVSLKASEAKYPQIVIYTLSTCPHCKAAKEYLSLRNIPFVNREIDTEDQYMAELIKIYDSMGVPENKRGVPLIIINDNIRLQGFNKDKVEENLKMPSAK
jgi:glutaredoxin